MSDVVISDWVELAPLEHLRVFQKDAGDGHLTIMVGREPIMKGKLGWHLSMSHRSNRLLNVHGKPAPGRLPTWDEIKEARYRFCPDEVHMAIILPPKAEYVNIHPTVMHLYEIEGDER